MLTLCTKDHIFKCTRADLHAFRSIWTALLWECSVCTFVSAIVNQPSVENLLLGVLPNTSSQRTEREQCTQLLFSHIITQQTVLLFRGKAAKGYSGHLLPILQLKKRERSNFHKSFKHSSHRGWLFRAFESGFLKSDWSFKGGCTGRMLSAGCRAKLWGAERCYGDGKLRGQGGGQWCLLGEFYAAEVNLNT